MSLPHRTLESLGGQLYSLTSDFSVIYVVCEIIATAHRLAVSPFRDEKAFIDKLDYQISLTGVLLKKIEEFRIVRWIHFVHPASY